jgi:alcohol dehydrogenase class IV
MDEHRAVRSGRYLHPAGDGVVYGPGSATSSLSELLARVGSTRPFLLTTRSVERAGLADELAAAVPGITGRFSGSREHTPEPVVLEAAAAARESGADGLVSLGGSSVVDLTKGVALVLAEGDDLGRLRLGARDPDGRPLRPRLDAPKLPHLALPTTLSGAEFTGGAGITDPAAGHKALYSDPKLTPRWVVLDPELARATPATLWASTGMKVLADTIELLCSTRANPVADALAVGALRHLEADLAPSTRDPDDLAARQRCLLAVAMVLPSLMSVGVGLVAALRHQLGGALGVPHGVASTIVLPHVLRWNADAAGGPLADAAPAIGAPSVDGLVARIEKLTDELGLPRRLRDVDVAREALPAVAGHALADGASRTNPRPVRSPDDILEVLEAAW